MDDDDVDGLGGPQIYICGLAAFSFCVKREVIEAAFKKPKHLNDVNTFLRGNDTSAALFIIAPKSDDGDPTALTADRVKVCLSAKAAFNSNCVFFMDVEKGTPITSTNMRSRICMRRMHHSTPIFSLIRSFFLPAIKNQTGNLKELDSLSKKEYITALIEYGMNLDDWSLGRSHGDEPA
ncbi:unnamed protein product [Dibothriocephalus latus]|uniref:Uncharacterized protein n=1 Tax=Dibothriocephalus latus TaxID=60516 RepID=A0A3P7M398_DIBLA|nr:unnamed protein product [Dibothriocephalus latus]